MAQIFTLQENPEGLTQIMRVGNFDHEIYGKFSITLSDLHQVKQNFENNVRRQTLDETPVLPFDYSHESEKIAAGWIKKLIIEKDKRGNEALFAEVDWTPAGKQKVKDREFAFVSPDFVKHYQDKETKKKYGTVLKGAALTNIPFIRDMRAAYALSEEKRKAFEDLKLFEEKNMDLAKIFKEMKPDEQKAFMLACGLQKNDKKLAEKLALSEKELKEVKEKFKLSEDELKKLKDEITGSDNWKDQYKLAESKRQKLAEEIVEIRQEMETDKREIEFKVMLSEGKVCPAQKEAYMKKDFDKFAELAEDVKLDESGNNSKDDQSEGGDNQEKIIKLAEKKMTDDETLQFGDAVQLVLTENPELHKKYEEE